MSRGPIVTVAGAGALGLSAALALARAGCRVNLCDPAAEPRASAVAAGMLAPVFEAVLDPATAGDLDLLLAARNLWPQLATRTGISIDRSGTAALGAEPWLAGVHTRLVRLGVRGSDLPRAMLEDLAQGVAPGLDAVLVREDWRLEPRAALQALGAAAQAAGVTFRAEAVRERGQADWLVIAIGAGAGLRDIAPELETLSPIKGQILRFNQIHGGRISLRGETCYAVPGAAGLALGATMEHGRDDEGVDPVALKPLAAAAGRLFPGLAAAEFGVSAGVRAATRDGLPMVGFSKSPGVILMTGARRNGWLLAPLLADIVVACVTGADQGPYAQRLNPVRFGAGRAE